MNETQWLTQTKFIPPRLRADFVPRHRLLDTLFAAVKASALTLISAPAGYGKTTLLAALYAQYNGKAVGWLALDEEDNDPTRFLLALVTALQKAQPGLGATAQSLLTNLEMPTAEVRRVISTLINELVDHPAELWLLLDDLHLISEPAIYTALDYLLERLPPQLHLLIATRHDPPLALARLRARGQLAEVGGERYLVSMLGDNTQWVQNVRAAGGKAVLRSGGREEVQLIEVPADQRAPILKAYLQRADGARPHIPIDKDAPLADFAQIAADYPVFHVTTDSP